MRPPGRGRGRLIERQLKELVSARAARAIQSIDEEPEGERQLMLFLTLAEAAAELHLGLHEAAEWLGARGLVRIIAGRALVIPADLVEAVRGSSGGPYTSWRSVAAVVGVSEDTVGRHRRRYQDATPCHFIDEDEIRVWWRAMHTPKPKKAAPRRKVAAHRHEGPLDVRGLVRELTR